MECWRVAKCNCWEWWWRSRCSLCVQRNGVRSKESLGGGEETTVSPPPHPHLYVSLLPCHSAASAASDGISVHPPAARGQVRTSGGGYCRGKGIEKKGGIHTCGPLFRISVFFFTRKTLFDNFYIVDIQPKLVSAIIMNECNSHCLSIISREVDGSLVISTLSPFCTHSFLKQYCVIC